ncbi:MAG TPA: endonuclease/exonuclease/phosphatase family protein [Polyangiaceae bacterium]
MRITAWNCNMGMHRKLEALLALRPDIAVLSECASPDVHAARPVFDAATSYAWNGRLPTKGLAVLTFGDFRLRTLPPRASSSHALPVRIEGPIRLPLLAVWTQQPDYIEGAHRALDTNRRLFAKGPGIVAGDLNSNANFDANRVLNHSRFVARMRAFGMCSAYHAHHREKHGAETRPTFFLYRHRDRPFHFDYVFLPTRWRRAVRSVDLGSPDDWLVRSDHLPLTVTLDL